MNFSFVKLKLLQMKCDTNEFLWRELAESILKKIVCLKTTKTERVNGSINTNDYFKFIGMLQQDFTSWTALQYTPPQLYTLMLILYAFVYALYSDK